MLKKYWRYIWGVAALLPFQVSAAEPPFVKCSGLNCKLSDLLNMLRDIYNWMLGFSSLVCLLFIIIGGVRMFYFSYMEDSDGELKSAKLTVSRAIAGLIIIAAAYFIVDGLIKALGAEGGFDAIFNKGLNP